MFSDALTIRNSDTTNNNKAALIFSSETSATVRSAAIQAAFTDHTPGSHNADLHFWTGNDNLLNSRMTIKDAGNIGPIRNFVSNGVNISPASPGVILEVRFIRLAKAIT